MKPPKAPKAVKLSPVSAAKIRSKANKAMGGC